MGMKPGGDASIPEVANASSRGVRRTRSAQASVGGHHGSGAVERIEGVVHWECMLWLLIPGGPEDQSGAASVHEWGRRYEAASVPLGEVVTAKIASGDELCIEQLGATWAKSVWGGRVGKSNEHILLAQQGCIISRIPTRIPDWMDGQAVGTVGGLPWREDH